MENAFESETGAEAEEKFSARPYQVELLERAKERNTIVCLGTGTGKTFISVMLIKELAHEVRGGNFNNGGRRTFFLVKTVPLAAQQAKAINKHTDLKVKHYVGEMGVDLWDKPTWEKEFNTYNVLVMTAQIFLDMLLHSFILLSQVNLLIFDECHHATKKDPYRQIMQRFLDYEQCQLPKVMGLTASIVIGKVKPYNIKSEIQELERTLRSTCETSQDEDVVKYAAKPKELVLVYPSQSANENMNILIQNLSDVLKSGIDFLVNCRVSHPEDEDARRYAKSALTDCKETLDELGPWAAFKVAEYLLNDLEGKCRVQIRKEGEMFCEFSATHLRRLQGVYCNFTKSDGSEDSGHCYFMPKLHKLLSIFKEFANSQHYEASEEERTLCAIVFVERRCTALILSQQLNMAAKLDQELSFINSNFVIGHGTGPSYSNKTEMNCKKQEEVLKKFGDEFNVLIATSVVEEGLDIPKCNVVCRFDFPKNYCSYVQSKGRARAKGSKYYMLVDEKQQLEKENELVTLQAIEEFLLRMCHDRMEPSIQECNESVDKDLLLPYKTGKGARVTMISSVPLLSKYCSKLPGDQFTQPKPVYKVEEIKKDDYRCKLSLPINCQLREDIIGDAMPSKKQAKMAAALKACEMLHKIGELDDDLLPRETLSDEESEMEEDEDEDEEEEEEEKPAKGDGKKPKAGTKKKRRRYKRKVPEVFVGSLVQDGQPQFLTTITIQVTKLSHPQEFVIIERLFRDKTYTFGMLTNKRIPSIRSFKLYPNYGEVTVSLRCHWSPVRVNNTTQKLNLIREFHCFLFSHVLASPVEFTPESENGYFIVMLKASGRSVDFERMRDELSREREQTWGNIPIDEDAVVRKNYIKSSKKYAVLNVRGDLTPMSRFPDKSKGNTYEQYFRLKYGDKGRIKKKSQPLVEVKEICRVNFLVDRKQGTKNKRDGICLVPELCKQIPICASLLSMSQILPSVLQRVTSLLLVADLKAMVAGEHDTADELSLPPIGAEEGSYRPNQVGEAPMEVENNVLYLEDDDKLFSDIRSMFCYSSSCANHPDSSFILQALTTIHSQDAFNLERLEMLGDSFLKLAVSLHLFYTYSNKDEGRLTVRKKNQISNLALYRAAAKKSLGEYLQSTQLDSDVWCPTGCQFKFGHAPQDTNHTTDSPAMEVDSGETVEAMEVDETCESGKKRKLTATERARQKCNTQMIADKSVADSIEGLIGAYLIKCGCFGALQFMKFLGLKVLPEVEANDNIDLQAENSKPGCYARFWPEQTKVRAAQGKGDMVFRLTSGLENFESNSIFYSFQQRLYLVEALTHASYHENRVTPSYQRLEFLGDALLDFLVTQHLYFRHDNLSPGDLTDIRQALVNNNIFATLAVEHDYHKYLKHMSPKWFQTMKDFIDRVEDEAEERKRNPRQTVTADPFIIVSEEEEEGIEAPKVLGDIFESVAGAIFLDSGMDLTKTWGVYYRMMKPYIDHYSVNIPRDPIRLVHEKDEKADFGKPETLDDGKIQVTLKVSWGKEFKGKGTNKKIAKKTAAKFAIKELEKKILQEHAAAYQGD